MPPRSKTLQEQGVPIPEKLETRSNRPLAPQGRSHSSGRPHGTARRIERGTERSIGHQVRESGGIGLLAGEFFLAIGLLILLFFAKSSTSLPDRIMNTIKRGTLICAAFIILALISGIGEGANRIAKAFGALIVVAMLLSAPIYGTDDKGNPSGILVDVDNIVKNDWVPSETHDQSSSPASANSDTRPNSPGQSLSQFGKDIEAALKREASLQGQTGTGSNPFSAKSLKTDVGNAAAELFNGVIPGSGTLIKKLFGL